MSAALCRAGPLDGFTEDAAVDALKHNYKEQLSRQPVELAQESQDASAQHRNGLREESSDGGPVRPPAAIRPPVLDGSPSTHAAYSSGQLVSSINSKSRMDFLERGDSQDKNGTLKEGGKIASHEEKAQRRKGLPSPLDLRESVVNGLGLLLSPATSNAMLSQIPEETGKRRSSQVDSPAIQGREKERILKLSPSQIQELTSSPKSLPLHTAPEEPLTLPTKAAAECSAKTDRVSVRSSSETSAVTGDLQHSHSRRKAGSVAVASSMFKLADSREMPPVFDGAQMASSTGVSQRPGLSSRTVSTPPAMRSKHPAPKSNSTTAGSTSQPRSNRTTPTPLHLDEFRAALKPSVTPDPMPSPMPMSIPLPPLSIPTYLQLELSSDRPSPLYIHRSVTSDFPYESSRVKIERLQNFLLLPPQLEQVLWFGALACLDAWLYSFTILPLRFLKALYILVQSWGKNLALEFRFVIRIIFAGAGRMWRRKRGQDTHMLSEAPTPTLEPSKSRTPSVSVPLLQQSHKHSEDATASHFQTEPERKPRRPSALKHRRTKSTPSALMPDHKADILKGFLVLISCSILMYFDASRMYHSIRGQAAIKLYVIYNVLEVCVIFSFLQG